MYYMQFSRYIHPLIFQTTECLKCSRDGNVAEICWNRVDMNALGCLCRRGMTEVRTLQAAAAVVTNQNDTCNLSGFGVLGK